MVITPVPDCNVLRQRHRGMKNLPKNWRMLRRSSKTESRTRDLSSAIPSSTDTSPWHEIRSPHIVTQSTQVASISDALQGLAIGEVVGVTTARVWSMTAAISLLTSSTSRRRTWKLIVQIARRLSTAVIYIRQRRRLDSRYRGEKE